MGKRGNPNLTWEKAHKSNLGLELGLWNDFTFIADFFRENRTDILVNSNSIPAMQGLPTENLPPLNLGRVLNQGFEIQLGYNKIFSKNFSMNIQTYLDYNKNMTKVSDEVRLGKDYAYQYRSTLIGTICPHRMDGRSFASAPCRAVGVYGPGPAADGLGRRGGRSSRGPGDGPAGEVRRRLPRGRGQAIASTSVPRSTIGCIACEWPTGGRNGVSARAARSDWPPR